MPFSEWIAQNRNVAGAAREAAILRAFERGDVPRWTTASTVPVEIAMLDEATNARRTCVIFVAPHYFSIGTDGDQGPVPMLPATAQAIASSLGAQLPTRHIVDAVWQAARFRLEPVGEPDWVVDGSMTLTRRYGDHAAAIAAQIAEKFGASHHYEAITAGTKKDVSLRNPPQPDRVCIYGWHHLTGAPIQGLSTFHPSSYVDYSHGVRLVSSECELDGEKARTADVLRDPRLSVLLSDEGPYASTVFGGPAYAVYPTGGGGGPAPRAPRNGPRRALLAALATAGAAAAAYALSRLPAARLAGERRR